MHFFIRLLVKRLNKGESSRTENEAKIGKDGKSKISINLTVKMPEVLEKLKLLGFELLSENETTLTGRITIEKIVQLVEIEQVALVFPDLE